MEKILIVDDNPAILEALSLLLEIHDYHVVTAKTQREALQIVQYQRIALVIQDMNFSNDTTSGEEGKALFYQLRELENACKRAAVLKPHGDITLDDFALQSLTSHAQPTKQEPTKLALENAMRDQQGVIAKVARQFGLSRQALYRRLQKFEIDY